MILIVVAILLLAYPLYLITANGLYFVLRIVGVFFITCHSAIFCMGICAVKQQLGLKYQHIKKACQQC